MDLSDKVRLAEQVIPSGKLVLEYDGHTWMVSCGPVWSKGVDFGDAISAFTAAMLRELKDAHAWGGE